MPETPHPLARIARRPVVRAALAVLALLGSCAVLAPLLANDQPLYLRAVDGRAWERARRSLVPLVEEIAAEATGGARPTEAQRAAVRLRTATLARYAAASEPCERLRALEAAVDAVLSAGPAERAAAAAHAVEQARSVHAGLEGAALRARGSFPALAQLDPVDGALIAGWLALLVTWATRRRRAMAWSVPAAVAGALLAAWLGGAPTGADTKGALARGEIVAERVLFAPLPFGYAETNLGESLRAPTWLAAGAAPEGAVARRGEPALDAPLRHPLGTDALGRDLLARILWGGRISLAVGLVSAALVVVLGVAFGALAGYGGAAADFFVTRVVEVLQSIPTFFLVLCTVALVPASVVHPMLAIVAVIALVGWTGVARLVRGEILRIREEEYVLAARALGLAAWRVLLRHVLPGAMGPVLVAGAFAVASGVLIESAVSFLGFGVRLPFPSWGALLAGPGRWWLQLFPGTLIFLTVVCTNVVGEGVRDALDPRRSA
jgi:peptide/nickel transport system permease protein